MSDWTVAIVQARMGSTRLPEKVLKDIAGKPMLQRVVERTSFASTLDAVVVATSTESQDDPVAEFCSKKGYNYVRGSEENVLSRYVKAAEEYDADTVVRITSDCPLVGPETIDRVVSRYRRRDAEFVTNTLYYTYPDGLDVEAFSKETLKEAHENAESDAEREHVTPYMRSSSTIDRYNVTNPVDISSYDYTDDRTVLRWTVDYPADLEFVRAVYDHLTVHGEWDVNQVSVLELLEREPEYRDINQDRTHDW